MDRAVELVLHPDIHTVCWVWSKADPLTLNVRSQSDPERWYRVNGQCECVDYQQHGNWCKHRIARALIIRAEELLLSLADAPLSTLPSWRDVPPRRQVRL